MMDNELEPVVGQWYWHHDKGQAFVVVAVEADGTVEIQHYDGDLETVDGDGWPAMDIELGEPPEDWSGPVDESDDDTGTDSDALADRDARESGVASFRQPCEPWAHDPEARGTQDDEDAGPPDDGSR
ncbi:hypothetical protein KBTX_01887 [wastewater metagenome]|uniref:Uncharacterized protein n=2 Tax=unclassified sequences TaxID=12908 RepID=A0A5B8RDK5_9ZZZZ|nr:MULTISPECIES: DUF6763 family protein [Arhodomonas]MCS4504327.1 hypothetical protein [Arhodomonas aquaeolei]QEA05564.1 hypothetical protein KBTEX_01887 [uncultured organism]